MATLRRHPVLSSMTGFLVLGVSVFALVGMRAAYWPVSMFTLQSVENFEPLDAQSAALLAHLRSDAALDNVALSYLNPSGEQAELVLAALRSWFESNLESVASTYGNAADAAAQLRRARNRFNAGSGSQQDIATAEAAVSTTAAAWDTLLSAAQAAALTSLNENQQSLATRIQENRARGVDSPFVVLELDDTAVGALRTALHVFRQRAAIDLSREAHAAAVTARESAVASAVGGEGVQALDALRGYLSSASSLVLEAELTVFPPEGFVQG